MVGASLCGRSISCALAASLCNGSISMGCEHPRAVAAVGAAFPSGLSYAMV